MANKLTIYNNALREIGQRKLSSLTEAAEGRYVLDDVWDDSVAWALEQGQWNHALRSMEIGASASLAPDFGHDYGFQKPDDWVRTVGLCSDEFFTSPIIDVVDEAGYWWASIDPIYVRFVSDDAEYGMDLGKWPATFTRFVELYLSFRICPSITGSKTDRQQLQADYKKALTDARSKDAMNDGAQMKRPGSWAMSRGSSANRSYNRA